MSYLVFARKWRPLIFEDVVGQEHITDTLKKAIEKNRVAHAYIFTGTRGVGKTTTARILARALNCENGPTPTPCGVCTSCKDIVSGASFDVLEIDGASNNSVNDIRELRENVGYGSMSGKYRIFVIDEVHMLSNSAFNALLKTLEEPPKNVIFIFATTEPQKIPATIHSRCQRYDFRRIGAEHILERLAHICDEEKISYERSALMLVARKADGSMRDGLSLLDQVYSFCHEGLNEKEVRSVLGLVGMEIYDRVMDAIAEKTSSVVLGLVQDVLYQGFDLHEFILGLQEHLRLLLFARIPDALTTRGVDLEADVAAKCTESAKRFSEGDLLRMAEIVRKTENELKWNAYPRFSVETMLLKLVNMDSTVSIEKMVALLGGEAPPNAASVSETGSTAYGDVKKKLNPDSSPPPVTTVSVDPDPLSDPPSLPETGPASMADEADASSVVIGTDAGEGMLSTSGADRDTAFNDSEESDGEVPDIKKLWPQFLETMLRDRPKLGSFLSLASVASCNAHTVDLRFSPKFNFQFQELNKKHNREEILRILHTFTSRTFELRMTVEADAGNDDQQSYLKQLGTMPVTINDEMENEPIIKTVLEIFDGEVIE